MSHQPSIERFTLANGTIIENYDYLPDEQFLAIVERELGHEIIDITDLTEAMSGQRRWIKGRTLQECEGVIAHRMTS